MKMPTLKRLLRDFLFVKAGTCPICGKVLFRTEEYLCQRCLADLPYNGAKCCEICGRPMPDEGRTICKDCIRREREGFIPQGGYVWLNYSKDAVDLISAVKFNRRPILGEWIGEQMAEGLLRKDWANSVEGIIPVPLHPKRLAERGYNQSEGIARGLSRKTGIPLNEYALVRTIDTPHQLGLNQEKRMTNVKEAFEVAVLSDVENRNLLLVDDVMTTGSTLSACLKTLLNAGANSVYLTACAAVS